MKKGRRSFIAAALALMLVLILHASAFSQEDPAVQPAGGQEAAAAAPGPGQVAMPAPGDGSAAVPPAQASEVPDVYTIKEGDTLWDISNLFLKDPFLWPLIWKLNTYITNPDLIYPGNTLRIPGLEPIERAMEMPVQPKEPVKAVKEIPVARETRSEMPFQGRRAVQTEEPVEEEDTGSKLILPEDIAPPLIDKYAMVSAGFVAPDDAPGDRVVGGIEPKSIFGFDDLILIKLRSPDEMTVGDKLLLYAPYRNVRHPATGRNYGKLTKILGIVQITAIEPSGIATGRITLSFDAVERGHLATTFVEPSLIYPSAETISKDIRGYILEVRDSRTVNGQADIVYLDRGSLDGVEIGDRFTVYLEPKVRGYPNKVIGEVQVFLVKDRTATAVVKKSTDAMARGDRISHKR